MALSIRLEDGLPITVEQARTILQSETDQFGLFIDLDRMIEYELYFMEERERYWRKYSSYNGGLFKPSQTAKACEWFQSKFNVPERLMYNQGGKIAFDKNVRKNLMDANISDDAKEFLKLHAQWIASNYRVNYLQQYISLPISYSVSTEGHRMVVANPAWCILTTSRIAASEPSIQNIARDMSDILCCPKGWMFLRVDSGQIEPRITYSHYIRNDVIKKLIILYNDAYYGILHYCLLPDEVFDNLQDYRVAEVGETGTDVHVLYKHEVTAEMKSMRSELKVIALAANYGSQLAGRDPVLSKRYTDRIVNDSQRKLWEQDVTQQVRRGIEKFHSAFGSEIIPEETIRYKKGTFSWDSHLVRCGINNPIQTTASDLMVCSVNAAKKILSKGKKSHIAYYKHDEGAFYIHESEKWLLEELSEVTAYNVTENGTSWIPIGAEPVMGQHINSDVPSVLDWSTAC